jgi:hypothetical protein
MAFYPLPGIDHFAQKVVELLPPHRPFFERNDSIEPYSQMLFAYEALPIFRERQRPLLAGIQSKVERLFHEDERADLRLPDQTQGLRAGLVYHQGVLNHPVIIGVDIVANFFRMFDREQQGDILTFSTGNIPLNNFFYRRGFNIGGVHVNLYPKKERNKIVYQHPLFEFDIVGSLQRTHQWKLHAPDSQQFLESIQEIIHRIDFSTCRTMGDQMTKINFHLWPLLFRSDFRSQVSRWVCLEYDDLLSDFLIHTIEENSDSWITQLLFNEELCHETLMHFEGKTNACNEARKMGTHFFWGLWDQKPERMLLHDGILRSENGRLEFEWSPSRIVEALRARQIYPGMFLKYSLLVFYAGMKPFAGYGSANSISQMKVDLVEFLAPHFPDDVENMKSLLVSNLTSVPVLLRRTKEGRIENYYAFDIMKAGGLSKEYFEKINLAPIKYFMIPHLPTMYDYGFNLYGKGEKENLKLDPREVEQLVGDLISREESSRTP